MPPAGLVWEVIVVTTRAIAVVQCDLWAGRVALFDLCPSLKIAGLPQAQLHPSSQPIMADATVSARRASALLLVAVVVVLVTSIPLVAASGVWNQVRYHTAQPLSQEALHQHSSVTNTPPHAPTHTQHSLLAQVHHDARNTGRAAFDTTQGVNAGPCPKWNILANQSDPTGPEVIQADGVLNLDGSVFYYVG